MFQVKEEQRLHNILLSGRSGRYRASGGVGWNDGQSRDHRRVAEGWSHNAVVVLGVRGERMVCMCRCRQSGQSESGREGGDSAFLRAVTFGFGALLLTSSFRPPANALTP